MTDRARVTVINDDPGFLAMVGDILTEEQYTVTLVDGDEAEPLDQITQSSPELLIIDLRLGSDDLTGWQVAQSVRATPTFERLPLLVCSGDVRALRALEDELSRMQNALGLSKPFGLDAFHAAVRRLLSGAEHQSG